MEALIAELEAATEGSSELDQAIDRIVNPGEWTIRNSPMGWPLYTTSLDAALTLGNDLDELCIEITIHSDGATIASCCWGPTEPYARKSTEGEALTPALALCAAALRARQAMKDAA